MPRFVNADGDMPSNRRSGGISLQQRSRHHQQQQDQQQHSQGGLSFPDDTQMSESSSPLPHPPAGRIHDEHDGDGGQDRRDDHRNDVDEDDDATALNDGDPSGDEEDDDDGRSVELLPPSQAIVTLATMRNTTTTATATATTSTRRAGEGEAESAETDYADEDAGARSKERDKSVAVVVRSPASRTLDALDSINASQDAVSLYCGDDDVGTGVDTGDGNAVGGGFDVDRRTSRDEDDDGGGRDGRGGGVAGDPRAGDGRAGRGHHDVEKEVDRDAAAAGGRRGGDGETGRSSLKRDGASGPKNPIASSSASASGPSSDRSSGGCGGDGKCRSDSDRPADFSALTRDERREDGISEGAKYRYNNAIESKSLSPERVTQNDGKGSRTATTTREECGSDDDRSQDDEEEDGGRNNRDVIFAKQRAKMEARSRARSQHGGRGQTKSGCRNNDTTSTTSATTPSKKSQPAKTSQQVGGPEKREDGAVAAGAASKSSSTHRKDDGGNDDDSGVKFRVACNACRREARRRRTAAPPTLSESSESSSDEGVDPEAHHSLCRRNPYFDQYLLDLCRLGVRMGCPSCANHARFDESRGTRHLKSCRRHRNYEKYASKEWKSRQQRLQTRKDEVDASKGASGLNTSRKKPEKTVVSKKSTVAKSAVSVGKNKKQSQRKKPTIQSRKPKQKCSKKANETRRQKEAGSSEPQVLDDSLQCHAGHDDEGESDCRACQRERLAGKKMNLFHKASCPRSATDARKKPINASMSAKTSLGQALSDSDTHILASSSSSVLVPSGGGSRNKNKKRQAALADSRQVTPSPSHEGEDGLSPSPYDLCYSYEEDEGDNYPRWESCPNPWGEFGHVEGDVVLFAPSSSTVGGNNVVGVPTDPDGIMPKRFALDPMSVASPYRKTHACGAGVGQSGGGGGYSVLVLKRDRLALRPWGFSTQVHEFGGACLVSMVSPCSPAEAAVDVGGFGCPPCLRTVATDDVFVSTESEPPAGSQRSSGLRVNDMILCVNGKIVGGMSEVELAIELEISGPEIILVVSRCIDRTRGNAALLEASEHERKSWYSTSFAGRNGLDWNDIGIDVDEDERQGFRQSRASAGKKRKTEASCATSEVNHSNRNEVSRHHRIRSMDKAKSAKRVSFDVQDNVQTVTESAAMPKTDHPIVRTCEDDDRDEARDEIRSCSPEVDEHGSGDFVERGFYGNDFDVDSDDDSKTDGKSRFQDGESVSEPDPTHEPEDMDEEVVEHPSGVKSNTPEESVFDGDEPWLGCVCGKTHPEPIVVFWIQCDTCRAWYNVSNECVGFSEDDANDMESWECSACRPSAGKTATEGEDSPSKRGEGDKHEKQQRHPRSPQSTPVESSDDDGDDDDDDEAMSKPHVILPVSTIVDVAERTWPGSNKLGGVGRVTNIIVDSLSGNVTYDVAYVLGGKEKGVPSKYVSVHDDIYSSSQSTLGTRSSRR